MSIGFPSTDFGREVSVKRKPDSSQYSEHPIGSTLENIFGTQRPIDRLGS